jgi:hypothetical protein
MVRRIFTLSLGLILAWSIWWAVGAVALQVGTPRLMAALRANGWTAQATAEAVTGFPGRFELELAGLSLRDPAGMLGLEGGRFVFSTPSFNPLRLTLGWPVQADLAVGPDRYAVESAGLATTLALSPGREPALAGFVIGADRLVLTDRGGIIGGAEALRLDATRAAAGHAFDILLSAEAVAPLAELRRVLDPEGRLPPRIDAVGGDLTIDFDAPWTVPALRDGRAPRVIGLALRTLDVDWGAVGLSVTGSLGFDPDGTPQGDLDVGARNWREVLALAAAAGLVVDDQVPALTAALALLALGRDDLRLPVTFHDGQMTLGPLPLGPAPRLAAAQRF